MEQLVSEKTITIDGYTIPVSVVLKIHEHAERFLSGDVPVKQTTPKPQPVARAKKPATASRHASKWRKLPPEVLKACKSIKYRAKQRGIGVVQFVRNPDLCEKRNMLQLKLSQPVKDYLRGWSVSAKKDSSIRSRFDMADLNRDGKPTRKGGK